MAPPQTYQAGGVNPGGGAGMPGAAAPPGGGMPYAPAQFGAIPPNWHNAYGVGLGFMPMGATGPTFAVPQGPPPPYQATNPPNQPNNPPNQPTNQPPPQPNVPPPQAQQQMPPMAGNMPGLNYAGGRPVGGQMPTMLSQPTNHCGLLGWQCWERGPRDLVTISKELKEFQDRFLRSLPL